MAVLLNKGRRMAHNSKSSDNANATSNTGDEVKPTIFHDFLGRGCAFASSPAVAKAGGDARTPSEASPSTPSASIGTSSGGGRGPIPATSDLGSERQVGNHFEGVPFYGQRSDLSGPELSNRFAGSKRSNSDSVFMGTSRDVFPQIRPDLSETSHLMKFLRSAGGERPRRAHEEETTFFGMHPVKPTSASLILQPPTGGRTEGSVSKWERVIPLNVGASMQYPPRAGQVAPFGYQGLSNRFKDTSVGHSVISQAAAADEGSRTGIKGSGLLSSINASGGISERNLSGVLPSFSKQKTGIHISEPESSTSPSGQGLTSSSRQMTIFYGGQAHVFDDVHPNKADIIMALAGSNGGSWSTTYAPKSSERPSLGENYLPSGENDTGATNNIAMAREFQGRLVARNTSHGFASCRTSTPPGHVQGSIPTKDANTSVQAAAAVEPTVEEKPEG